jgi:hypothetical protein
MTDTATRTDAKAFIEHLYTMRDRANANIPRHSGEARTELATLRRGLQGGRHRIAACGIVFRFEPSGDQLDVWLLIGALYALHPVARPRRGAAIDNFAWSMGKLAADRGDAVDRRFNQVASAEGDSLEHYLRQSIQLLKSASLDYNPEQLLRDTELLLSAKRTRDVLDRQRRTRVQWVSNYFTAKNQKTA